MSDSDISFFAEARKGFHAALFKSGILSTDTAGIPSIADKASTASRKIASSIVSRLGDEVVGARLAGQMAGNEFETIVGEFIEETFPRLKNIRPGSFSILKGKSRFAIAAADQYSHLASLDVLAKENPELAVAIGMDYIIKPDVMVLRFPVSDAEINLTENLVDDGVAKLSTVRLANNPLPLLHASISCKWTIRSDRAQNARSEALNLVRNRKGRVPHIVVVTAEPTPNRLASIALGTGDIDCVYHIALPELRDAVHENGYEDAAALLETMILGKRLRDISDLPLDLAT
ncbi:NgoMIV family type II restriction endonuclease [Rhizobium giardinii]|uniref:NgoMIV family type II restriction endonuclease n=1 Tax=Rhizobium giardinii TaxID=56731 RepID=UPI003D6EC99F